MSFDTIINFQDVNLGWDIDTVGCCVDRCFHAMALDERRETFNVTRLDPDNEHETIREVWFRGVHSDIGGGSGIEARSNIALQWMLNQGQACGLTFNEIKAESPRYSKVDCFAGISENKDVKTDPRREVKPGDEIDPSAQGVKLAVGERHQCEVLAELKFNWSGVCVVKGASYKFAVAAGDIWKDGDVECGPGGWKSDELPWYKEGVVEFAERFRRVKEANWFALIGALGDEDDNLFVIGDNSSPFPVRRDADLYLFANNMKSKYGNNTGSLKVTITRTA